MKHNKFWDIIFDIEDWICFGSKETDTRVFRAADTWPVNAQFFSINALAEVDYNPTESWHSKLVGRRADANVTKFRTFLLEFDKLVLDMQMPYIHETEVPYSTVTFSGSKSLHVLVALEQPLANRREYDSAVRRLHQALPAVDQSTKNPSRFSRVPGSIRMQNKAIQQLVEANSRVPNKLFFDWLDARVPAANLPGTATSLVSLSLNKWTRYFLIHGAPAGEWNETLFKAACDMARCGWNEEKIKEKCAQITGMLDFKDMKTIKSAVTASKRPYAGAPNPAD